MEEAREREIRVGLLSSDSMVCDLLLACSLLSYDFATKENMCSCVYIMVMRERHLAISLNRFTEKKGCHRVALPGITGCASHSNARREECITSFKMSPNLTCL